MQREIIVDENIKGLIFDIDGTIADSMPLHFKVFQKVGRMFGVNYTKELFLELAGIPALETCQIVKDRFGKDWDPSEFVRVKEEMYLENMNKVVGVEPVINLIHKYRDILPMACGTGGDRFSATKVLTALDLDFLIENMVCAEDVTEHKPHPETFLKAASLIGVTPKDCMVFEDGALGIEAGNTAGMHVVDVTQYYRTTIGE
ncbi:HAD family phosphatase [Halosquirtibacter laminarini]|uniref:HAD family phosphatase n=1 Tax=Halosquirtibacter laminarini TaxID=3374600 RepID=A0AC61NCE0_9BACT|nr:HAD family phosphatase [Prolixibacteraceae bacterium]